MTLVVFGINHKTASVSLREKVAFCPDGLVDAQVSLVTSTGASEAVIVSTCNRTEIYVYGDCEDATEVQHWLSRFHGVNTQLLTQNSYQFVNGDAVNHIMRVASGLDSLILGEPQILGQVKQAYSVARNAGTVNSYFDRLFQQTFSVAKRVRTETDIGANAVSVAFAAVQLARHIFSSLLTSKVLLIGAGETIELVATHLVEQGVTDLMVANRTLAKASDIAKPLDGKVLTLAQIPTHLHEADIVISSTASQLPIIGKGMVESALKERRHKPILMVDLAVPRDIEGEVSELEDAYLYTVDDLQQIVEQNIQNRKKAAQDAEQIIAAQVELFTNWRNAQGSIDVVRNYRQHSETQRDKLKNRALNQLAEGRDPAVVIDELANRLSNAMMHGPTKSLKLAAESQDINALRYLRKGLGLEKDND